MQDRKEKGIKRRGNEIRENMKLGRLEGGGREEVERERETMRKESKAGIEEKETEGGRK